jgi:hypothetical protein
MNKTLLLFLIAFGLYGCAGIDITPLSKDQVEKAHQGNSDLRGYIVYAPMVVVEISAKDVCLEKDSKGSCAKPGGTGCFAGSPFVLPDYSKPYLVNVRSGFGKTGVDITITDGWRLGNIKDNSDNTAVLGTVEKILGGQIRSLGPGARAGEICKVPGLYQVLVGKTGIELKRILIY